MGAHTGEQHRRGAAEEHTWPWLLQRWTPALVSALVMLVAYVALAGAAPALLATTTGFWLGLVGVTIAVSLAIGLVSRGLGLYTADARGQRRHDPQRQGLAAPQLALLAALLIYPRLGIAHTIWTYLAAFLALGAVGGLVVTLCAGRVAATPPPIASTPWLPPRAITGGPPRRVKVAPKWAQRLAGACLFLGIISLVRLVADGQSYFLWGGLALLTIGVLLPGVIVAVGGGRAPEA